MQRFWRLLVGLMISGGILAGCQSKQPAADTAKTNIVTTTDFYGSVAKAVGGKHVTVTSIINKPSVDPHDFEPTPAVAKTVSKADIVVANGLGYDGWMNKVVRSTKQAKLIRVGEDVLPVKPALTNICGTMLKRCQQPRTILLSSWLSNNRNTELILKRMPNDILRHLSRFNANEQSYKLKRKRCGSGKF